MDKNERVLALLIDAENVSAKYMKVLLDELSLYGTLSYKRIYGDWTSAEMASWKRVLQENNIPPIQQFSYTQGKNASDSAMIIDAMDVLYAGKCDGFCIVSSDSDFTRLAGRLRESRMFVIGMGESKTPMAFRSACDTFKYLDVLLKTETAKAEEAKQETNRLKADKKPAKAKPATKTPEPAPISSVISEVYTHTQEDDLANCFVPLEDIIQRVKMIIDQESDEDGSMPLARVGSILGRIYPDFDPKNYGKPKLHKLISDTNQFEVNYVEIQGGGKNFLVKNK
jgi:uncharacterized LabA/DUF88 family protein